LLNNTFTSTILHPAAPSHQVLHAVATHRGQQGYVRKCAWDISTIGLAHDIFLYQPIKFYEALRLKVVCFL
jgi:hypothetical protein